ncbi:hypothetical protein D0T11_12520 [Hymenobacter rubripertinctus]|uniref:Uncharacterized protein n=1 Tax=Hymenobacter rubripertinctus TaxID=2029981 RepID=A0A418QVS9_9BACT|nr:hypothetical protein D0T11_12520 [Hymenobacter rubripertinctus]
MKTREAGLRTQEPVWVQQNLYKKKTHTCSANRSSTDFWFHSAPAGAYAFRRKFCKQGIRAGKPERQKAKTSVRDGADGVATKQPLPDFPIRDKPGSSRVQGRRLAAAQLKSAAPVQWQPGWRKQWKFPCQVVVNIDKNKAVTAGRCVGKW